MFPASKPVILTTSSHTPSHPQQNNGIQTSSLTSSFLSAFSSRPSSSRLSSGISGSGDHFPASSLAQRLSRRDNLWQGPSILRNRNLSPQFEGLRSRPTTPNVDSKSPCDTVDCHLAPFQSPGPSTPRRPPSLFEGFEASSYKPGRPISPLDRTSFEDILSNHGSRGNRSLRNAISFDAIRAVDSEDKMGTQNVANAPPAWSSPLSPASPNSSRRMAKDNDGKTAMPATPRTEQYIQHLETQVATLTESMSSNASNNIIRKVKQLTRERAVLQQELSEWERSFETRVQDELVTVQQHEAQLAAQVRALQIDNRLKDHKITEQAREIKHTRQRLKDSQSTNHELEQRVDDLTGLLAQSPVMLNSKKRPQTMSSKTSSRLSESTWPSPRLPVRPTSMVDGTTKENEVTPIRRASTSLKVHHEVTASPTKSHVEKTEEASTAEMEDSSVFDATNLSGVGQPSIIFSEPSELRDSSRLSSVSSATSTGDCTPPDNSSKRHSVPAPSRRRMRKFPSGAHQLKPLVLQNLSEQPEKVTGRARCNSFPYTPLSHAHPTPPAYRFPHASTDLHTITDNERYQEPNSTGPLRARHGNTRSRDLARARTLDALEGGPHQCQSFQERADIFKLGPLSKHDDDDDNDDDEFEPSITDCVVPGVSSPTLSGHNSSRSLFAHSPPASDLGIEIEPASADCDTTTLWQEQQRSLKAELSEINCIGLDGVVISDGSRQSHQSTSQSPSSDTRSGSVRYKFRRPTVDKIMEAESFNGGTNKVYTPALYRGPSFEASSRVLTPASKKTPESSYDCLPRGLSSEPAESIGVTLFSAARQLISNTRCRVNQLQSLWIGSFSWIILGLFLHRRDSQPASGDNSLDYAALYEAPEAHKNQMSLIDGFKYTMTRRFRTRITNIAAPIIERTRKSSFINSMRCWSHLMTVILFALGFAARYGASYLIETEPAAPKDGRCPLCGAIAHDNTQGCNNRCGLRANNAPSKAGSPAFRS